MTSKVTKRKAVVCFIEFLLFVGLFGGVVGFINHLLRKNGLASACTQIFLVAITIFVYYKAWKWMCCSLDIFTSSPKVD